MSIRIGNKVIASTAANTAVDDQTIVKDENDIITAIGLKTTNDDLVYNWTGTLAEYNAIAQKDPETIYYITDDVAIDGQTAVVDVDLNNLSAIGQAKLSGNADGKTIRKTASNTLQAIGILDAQNDTNALKVWTGTKDQYDDIASKDNNTLYHVIDDDNSNVLSGGLAILEALYPVGAIYIGTMASCPLEVLGIGTWQLKAADRVLEGSGTYSAKTTVEAGLPDHTHTYMTVNTSSTPRGDDRGGCYNSTTTLTSSKASASNAIYGKSNTVQPAAYIVNIWERIS